VPGIAGLASLFVFFQGWRLDAALQWIYCSIFLSWTFEYWYSGILDKREESLRHELRYLRSLHSEGEKHADNQMKDNSASLTNSKDIYALRGKLKKLLDLSDSGLIDQDELIRLLKGI